LKKLIKGKIQSGDIVLLDKVADEAGLVSKKIVVKTLDFVGDKKLQTNTSSLLPYPKFFNMLDNEFANHIQKSKLNDIEFEKAKNEYLETADAKFLLYLLEEKKKLGMDDTILVTEETSSDNDNKPFKKLPLICSNKEIPYCDLVTLFQKHFEIKLSEYVAWTNNAYRPSAARHIGKTHKAKAISEFCQRAFSNISILNNNRVVFNIKGNKYRLIVTYRFDKGIAYINWFGTHADYDKIDANTIWDN